MRAIMLLSGGLDSLLAARVILDQGIELDALNFLTVFCNCTPKSRCCSSAANAVRQLGIELNVINNTQDFLNVVKNPAHGYGSNLNPCIDCRILMFRKAGEYMRQTGASFIVTGEVLGERPMSQRREVMKLIEKEAGLEGLVVRPLSAANLEPSIPEQRGWVDRSKLLGIRGRSRKPQIALAASYGLKDYPCPAGGCLLTDPIFAARMRDLMKYQPGFGLPDVLLLKVGRHLRLTDAAKVVVGRDEPENERLRSLARDGDELLEAVDVPGPLSLLRGCIGVAERLAAAKVTLTYGKARDRAKATVRVSSHRGDVLQEKTVAPLPAAEAEALRIGPSPRVPRRNSQRSLGNTGGRAALTENRYTRQSLFSGIGETGQRRIRSSTAVIIGCGALGTVIANSLCRAGVGRLRIVDRDFVEESNLQRQSLFTEQEAEQRLPKAIAAAEHLARINSDVAVEPVVADAHLRNMETLLAGADVVLDATDNLETRFLINDACVKAKIPWVYGGAVGAEGMVMPIIPGETPCLRCLIEEPPPPGALPTCDRAGILNAASGAVASLQTAAALRILVGAGVWPGPLLSLDVWKGQFRKLTLSRRADCPACAYHRFEFLEGKGASWTSVLCSRDLIQVMPPEERPVDLAALARDLSSSGDVSSNSYMLTLKVPPHELTLFPNGRALIKGAADVAEARSLYARYVGI